jgi:hypothetical protein
MIVAWETNQESKTEEKENECKYLDVHTQLHLKMTFGGVDRIWHSVLARIRRHPQKLFLAWFQPSFSTSNLFTQRRLWVLQRFNGSIQLLTLTNSCISGLNCSVIQTQWHFQELRLFDPASELPDRQLLDLNCSVKSLEEAMQAVDMDPRKPVAMLSGKQLTLAIILMKF